MHLAATFKLRTNSRHKEDILDHAMREYAQLQTWLLAWAEAEIERLYADGAVTSKAGKVYFPARHIADLLPPLRECLGEIHSSLRDAARKDVAAMLASYLSLRHRGQSPGFPTIRSRHETDFAAALDNLASAADVGEGVWRRLTGDLARKDTLRPPALWFPRMDGSLRQRNAALLVDTAREKGNYFVLLFLLPKGHYLAKTLETHGNLQPVGIEDTDSWDSRSSSAIICPLEFGEWHRKKFLESGAVPKAARLYRDWDDDYYLTVAFEMPEPEEVPLTDAVMSVIASNPGLLAYAVVSPEGNVLETGDYRPQATHLRAIKVEWQQAVSDRQRRCQSTKGFTLHRFSKHIIHEVTNDLVRRAVKHGARIVIQAASKGESAPRVSDRKRKRGRPLLPLAQVRATLEYKAELAGLPRPRWAKMWEEGGTEWIHRSRFCANCGALTPKNGRRDVLCCPTCGEHDFAQNLAVVVARSAVADLRTG
jgi:hypothetical protein